MGEVFVPQIYGLSGGPAPFSVNGDGGSRGDFSPRGSLESMSYWLLRWIDIAVTATLPCEYCPPLFPRGIVELPIGGAEDRSRCAYGGGSVDVGEDSSDMAFFPVYWSFLAEVGRLPDRHGYLRKDACCGDGVATKTARLQPAPARVFFVVWSEDVVIILFTVGVLCTMDESSIQSRGLFCKNK